MSTLSDGKEETAITQSGRAGNSMKRYPTYAVNTAKHREAMRERGFTEEPLFDRKPTHYQHIRTSSDNNGNSRSAYVLYALSGDFHSLIERGYNLPDTCLGLHQLPSVNVTPKEYNSWLQLSKED
jgi:hypothetical protein